MEIGFELMILFLQKIQQLAVTWAAGVEKFWANWRVFAC